MTERPREDGGDAGRATNKAARSKAAPKEPPAIIGAYAIYVHIDDRADFDVPVFPVQTTTVQYANPCHFNGQHSHATN